MSRRLWDADPDPPTWASSVRRPPQDAATRAVDAPGPPRPVWGRSRPSEPFPRTGRPSLDLWLDLSCVAVVTVGALGCLWLVTTWLMLPLLKAVVP
jgi:hypothetical protein